YHTQAGARLFAQTTQGMSPGEATWKEFGAYLPPSRIPMDPPTEYIDASHLAALARPRMARDGSNQQSSLAVFGPITLPISVILFAGKPLSSACFRIAASSFAR